MSAYAPVTPFGLTPRPSRNHPKTVAGAGGRAGTGFPPGIRKAAARHAAYLARYLNVGVERTPGVETLAIVAASENGKFNQVISSALASRFKTATVKTTSSVFKPEFVSDGLFTQVFNGSTSVFKTLELAPSLDAVLLARQTVQYGNNASLGVLTATMKLEVQVAPIAGNFQSQAWSFTASGAGFSQAEARSNAEDRLVKQIAKDTKMSL